MIYRGFHIRRSPKDDPPAYGENPRYGPGNPDWERDRVRDRDDEVME